MTRLPNPNPGPGATMQMHLLEQRRILVSGPLDEETATSLSAQLMMLDGLSSRDVEVVLNSSGGPLTSVFAVLDVIGLMRARVSVTCIGEAAGTAAGLVACGSGERRAARHARLSLRCGTRHSIEGTATDLSRAADQLADLRTRYIEVLVRATGQDTELLADEVDRGGSHTASEALAFGLLDSISGPAPPGES